MPDKVFNNTFRYKVIYVMSIDYQTHRGLLKIGDSTLFTDKPIDQLTPNSHDLIQSAKKRIKEYTTTAGLKFNVLWTELAIRTVHDGDGILKLKAFRDYQVQDVLKNSNMPPVKLGDSAEWYDIDLETARRAIDAVKLGFANLSNSNIERYTPIILRPEQIDCVDSVVTHFKKADRFLINAKMRFGKTLVTLEIIKRCAFKKTIIITHRPDVDVEWYENFMKIFHGTDYIYGSKASGYSPQDLLSTGKPFIYFTSVQDLRGSSQVGGKYDKNSIVFSTNWDLLTIDEAHEGIRTALGEDTVKAIFEEGNDTKLLALSGTPFNIIQDYDTKSIYTYDYITEQMYKSEWDLLHFGDSNPYDELPALRIYTYSLGDIMRNSNYIAFEDKAFNFREFFRTFTGDFSVDYADMPDNAEIGDFVHEADVLSFLNLMTKTDDNNHYPYSNEEYRELFKHSLWMVPGVKEAKALKKLMMKHPVFGSGQFNIVNVAGNGDEEEEAGKALSKVRKAIKEAGDDYTITLSCRKLTTGVTVKEWTAVFMLAGSFSTSAASYLQTIFRVQSPCNTNGQIKENAYVFDFAPDRALKMVASAVAVSPKGGKTKSEDRKILGDFLNYCPVISISGSKMQEYSTTRLLQELKKVYADKAVRNGFDDTSIYNDELFKLQAIDIKKFDELKGIIGSSKAQQKTKDIPVNAQGLTGEEYEESERLDKKKRERKPLTEEEKARLEELKHLKKVRNNAISILRGISTRMPLLIYGADTTYDDEITLDRFVEIVDNSSWEEFMPKGVSKNKFKNFQKYYDEEVFIAAGRRIRNIAREADTLDPTERVIKIANLFSNFKNPDKETVLTPWRVVNMHMSDCLGGWDFWDEQHQYQLDTPRFVDQGEATAKTFSREDTQILEINSKTGLYPLYVTYSCYRTKLRTLDDGTLTIEDKQSIWFQAVEENMFIICKTPMAKTITKRTLLGYTDGKINSHCFNDLINTMQNKPEQFRQRVLRGNFWGKGVKRMRFDAIVGNPPYQESTEGTSDKPIYHLFMDSAFSLSSKVSFITPARFLFNAGKTPKEWNRKVLNDEHIKVVLYAENSTDIFPNVVIKGGVAITYRDTDSNFGKIGIYTKYSLLAEISQKVIESSGFSPLGSIIYQQSKFNLNALYKLYPEYKNVIGSKGREKRLTTPIFEQLSAFNDERKAGSDIGILGLIKNIRFNKFIEKSLIEDSENLGKYKVVLPASNGSGLLGETLSSPVVGEPYVGFTQSFISFGCFDTREEAEATLKYLKTKFVRIMLGVLKVTQHNHTDVWGYVPIQDFSKNSDIDWEKSVVEIDKYLYNKYGLSDDEIDFIESTAQVMD